MSTYPPPDDRLTHLIAQEINCNVESWKLALFIARGVTESPEVQAELRRIEQAHADGEPCGDRNCRSCWNASLVGSRGGEAS